VKKGDIMLERDGNRAGAVILLHCPARVVFMPRTGQ